jgi:predicted phosphoribosyltransferase
VVAVPQELLRLGTEVNPSDIRKGRRKIVEELAKDLDPATKEAVTRVYENWKGDESEEELKRILARRRRSQR